MVCALCNDTVEDELHLFTDCSHTISCWKEVNLWQSLEHQFHQSRSFSSIILSTISSMEETKQHLFAYVLWSIWRARNESIWENKQANPMTSFKLASDLIRYFNWCLDKLDTDPTPVHVLTWKKPTNWLKFNVDRAIFMKEEKFGIGICFRDSLSSFVQAHTMIFPFVVTAAECEATTMKHALTLALFNGFERVIFESDCQQVVNVLCNDHLYANELGTLLSTCSFLLNSNANYNIIYVRRQTNRVAHNLARASLFQSSSSVHHYYPPVVSLILY